jgi:hypothetical protein
MQLGRGWAHNRSTMCARPRASQIPANSRLTHAQRLNSSAARVGTRSALRAGMSRNIATLTLLGCISLIPSGPFSQSRTDAPSIEPGTAEVEVEVEVEAEVLQDPRTNGVVFDGAAFGSEAMRLTGGNIGGLELENLAVEQGQFRGTTYVNGQFVKLSGKDFMFARLQVALDSFDEKNNPITRKMTIYISDVYPISADSSILAHQIQVYKEDSQQWAPYCANGGSSIPLNGAWDPHSKDALGGADLVTLACRDGALAKCTEWGYWPWATTLDCNEDGTKCEWVELGELHQACTRMLRADYCGDGTAHTVDGVAIDVFDDLDISKRVTKWPVEAEWGPDGATCLGHNFRSAPAGVKPACFASIAQLPECGLLTSDARLANGLAK